MLDQAIVSRPWVPPTVDRFVREHEDRFESMTSAEVERLLHRLLDEHEQRVDHECLGLNAGSNVINPKAAKLLSSGIGNRPSLGYPGEKYNTGMEQGEQIEILLAQLMRKLFGARYAEIRVPSGSLANLYAYMATTNPGDRILSFAGEAGGHATHHTVGAAGLYGLEVHALPFDPDRMDVDGERLARVASELEPKLIIVAGSLCLFPYSLAAVREVADSIGAFVLYDAAHMGGIIAGGRFQQPLAEGADLVTGSTYKSFGGPPSGFVLTNSSALAERLDRIAFPGLTANFDLSRTAAMILAVLDLLEHGRAYADMCIRNAQALAQALEEAGCAVHHVAGRGHTESHHVAMRAAPYGGGGAAANRLALANVLTAGIGLPIAPVPNEANGIRLGTQEITRWGLEPEHMAGVAELMARILVKGEDPATVRPDVVAFRADFQTLHYMR